MRTPKKSNNRKIIAVVGPNASGKSSIAVALAKKFSGAVISADSRQIYKGFNITSGKITKKEMGGIPHHLLDAASPQKTFTVAQYKKLARKAISAIWKRKKLPILCGGTGFYIRAVIDGLVMPEVKPNLKLRKELERKTVAELFAILKKKDPRRAEEIDSKNPRRLIRALEIVAKIDKVPEIKNEPIQADVLIIGVRKDQKTLKKLIRGRLLKRLKRGLLKEIQKLHSGGLSWKRLYDFGLEYRYGALFLQNKISYENFVELLQKEIWHYAKRQMTWFKKDKRIRWIKNEKEAIKTASAFLKN